MRRIIAAAALICVTHADAQPYDGTWWREKMDDSLRTGYIFGYLQGMETASMMIPFGVCNALSGAAASKNCYDVAWKAAAEDIQQYQNVRVREMMDGLNTFYADYRNRKVLLPGALNYVGLAIRGKPAADLEQMAERMRQAANK